MSDGFKSHVRHERVFLRAHFDQTTHDAYSFGLLFVRKSSWMRVEQDGEPSNPSRNAPSFVFGKASHGAMAARLIFKIDVGERLTCAINDHVRGIVLHRRPRLRKAIRKPRPVLRSNRSGFTLLLCAKA
jgi:hypothetical protein